MVVMNKGVKRAYEKEEGFDEDSVADGVLELDFSKRSRLTGENDQNDRITESSSKGSGPLGLKLSKTSSFLELLAMKLSQSRSYDTLNISKSFQLERRNKGRCPLFPSSMENKMKASNFPALLLKIGSWERISQHENYLVAKFYYAKRKIVWEILELGIKNKIEIQFSDISAIRATFRTNEPGILEIQLSNPPVLFQEINPQPRKHTLWKPVPDFTEGQAPTIRKHYVQFIEGKLEKYYQKILHSDERLLNLSQKPFPSFSSPYFHYACNSSEKLTVGMLNTSPLPYLPALMPSFSESTCRYSGLEQPRSAENDFLRGQIRRTIPLFPPQNFLSFQIPMERSSVSCSIDDRVSAVNSEENDVIPFQVDSRMTKAGSIEI